MHSHLDLQWQLLGYRRFVRGLARNGRVIRYDKLGTGLSDPTPRPPAQEERVEDLRCIVGTCARDPVVLFGFSEGGPLAISYAVQHKVAALVLYGTSVRAPYGVHLERLEQVLAGWGSGLSLDVFAPSLAGDPQVRELSASIERAAASPAMAISAAVIGGQPVARTSPSTPHDSSLATPSGLIISPESVSAPLSWRSTTRTRSPARASSIAVTAPAQRAPTITTSKQSMAVTVSSAASGCIPEFR
jgi:pimeloyl-ACP methyl ester carboxylesterase